MTGVWHRRTTVPAAHATVYDRPDGRYVTTWARSTVGLWLETATFVVVPPTADDATLAETVFALVGADAELVGHPARDEWSARRRETVGPILRHARARSWRAFLAPALLVTVSRTGSTWRVAPEQRHATRLDVFETITEETIELPECTLPALATALGQALRAAERAEAEHLARRLRRT